MRLLTLEAIQVGTGWVADANREQILSAMLDECVGKLIDKKDYIVRVHPSDGALVTQVLENSREKLWSMEVNPDLEPGSLEVENSHAMVKNSSKDRKEFVQGILENLILDGAKTGSVGVQAVTDTLMDEMQKNPLLEQAAASQAEEDSLANSAHVNDTDSVHATENQTEPQTDYQNNSDMQYLGQDMEASPENANFDDALANNGASENNSISDPAQAENPASLDSSIGTKVNPEMENIAPNALENTSTAEFANENTIPQEMPPEINSGLDGEQEIDTSALTNTDAEADNLVGEFLNDISDNSEAQANAPDDLAGTENTTLTGTEDFPIPPNPESDSLANSFTKPVGIQSEDSQLSPELADDLLAEMGFAEADAAPK